MATDYSWIQPLGQNMQNAFGLNPRAAAEGRTMQAEQAAAAAKADESTANASRVRAMTPYEIAKLIADKDTSVAQGGVHTATSRKVNLEGDAIAFGNIHREALVKAVENGALTVNQETGELTLNPNASPAVIGSIAAGLPAAELVKLPGLISQYNLNIAGQSMKPAALARGETAQVTAAAPVIQAQAFNGGENGSKPMSMADQKNYTDVIQNTAKALMLRYTNSSQVLSEADAIAIATKATSLYPMMRPDLAVEKMLSENNLTIGPVENNNWWFNNDRVTLRKGEPGQDGDKREASIIDPYSFTPAPRPAATPTTIAGTVSGTPANAAGVTQVGGTPAGGNTAIAGTAASTGNAVTDHNNARTIAGAISQEGSGTSATPPAINPNLGQPNQGVQGTPRVVNSVQEAAATKDGEIISVQGKLLKKMNGQFIPIQ
jgi:hypothetical protein